MSIPRVFDIRGPLCPPYNQVLHFCFQSFLSNGCGLLARTIPLIVLHHPFFQLLIRRGSPWGYTVEIVIMHTVGPLKIPMHFQRYAK